jgi:hypothetical protein
MADVAGGNDQLGIIELATEGGLEFLFNGGVNLGRAWFQRSALGKHADSAGSRNRRRVIALR